MPEDQQRLDLLQISAVLPAQYGVGATEVVAGASIPICLGDHLTLTRLALRCFVDGSQLWLASRAA